MSRTAAARFLPWLVLTTACVTEHPVSVFKGDPVLPDDTPPTVTIVRPTMADALIAGSSPA